MAGEDNPVHRAFHSVIRVTACVFKYTTKEESDEVPKLSQATVVHWQTQQEGEWAKEQSNPTCNHLMFPFHLQISNYYTRNLYEGARHALRNMLYAPLTLFGCAYPQINFALKAQLDSPHAVIRGSVQGKN